MTNLIDVPRDVLRAHILPHLSAKSLSNLGASSSAMKRLCSDDAMWKTLLLRDFIKKYDSRDPCNCMALYCTLARQEASFHWEREKELCTEAARCQEPCVGCDLVQRFWDLPLGWTPSRLSAGLIMLRHWPLDFISRRIFLKALEHDENETREIWCMFDKGEHEEAVRRASMLIGELRTVTSPLDIPRNVIAILRDFVQNRMEILATKRRFIDNGQAQSPVRALDTSTEHS